MNVVKLWLDDLRTPPAADWHWVKTVDDAIKALETGSVEVASLDHDLGASREQVTDDPSIDSHGSGDPESGLDLVRWMALHDVWPLRELRVRSGDREACEVMVSAIEEEGYFRRVEASTVLVRAERQLGPGDE